MSPVLDAFVGGWQLAGTYTYRSGNLLSFGAMLAPDSVEVLGGTGKNAYWFDTTGFRAFPAFTRRTNPINYESVRGPSYKVLDFSLAKSVSLGKGQRFQFRLEAVQRAQRHQLGRPGAHHHVLRFRQNERSAQRHGGPYPRVQPPLGVLGESCAKAAGGGRRGPPLVFRRQKEASREGTQAVPSSHVRGRSCRDECALAAVVMARAEQHRGPMPRPESQSHRVVGHRRHRPRRHPVDGALPLCADMFDVEGIISSPLDRAAANTSSR